MRGGAGARCPGARTRGLLAAVVVFSVSQGPQTVQVGRVTAVHWPGHGAAATALAEFADRSTQWPGLSTSGQYPIRLVLAPNARVMDSITGSRLPEWGAGAAFPNTNTLVVVFGRDMQRVAHHELAHLALRNTVGRMPRWLDEGYASRAAGEWSRLDALRLNWQLVRGRAPRLAEIDRDLRGGSTRAHAAYGFATSAVLLLERMGGERGLEPLMTSLAERRGVDAALRRTYGITLDGFERRWARDLKSRYGWLLVFTSVSVFWAFVGGGVAVVWYRRRKRDRERRLALNVGWIVPVDDQPES